LEENKKSVHLSDRNESLVRLATERGEGKETPRLGRLRKENLTTYFKRKGERPAFLYTRVVLPLFFEKKRLKYEPAS